MKKQDVVLSDKSQTVLRLIAQGASYTQIVDAHSDISYLDIFKAAQEALDLCPKAHNAPALSTPIKAEYPRAYEPWTLQEDQKLIQMKNMGASSKEMARHFERKPSAIRSRLKKLQLAQITDM